MKKIITILLIFVVCESFGQVKFGFNAGITLSQQEQTIAYPSDDLRYGKAIQLGAKLNIPLIRNSEYLYFQPEIYFVQKGYKYSGVFDFGSGEIKYTDKLVLNYMELPINLKLKVLTSPFYLLGGFYGAYCLDGFQKFTTPEGFTYNEISIAETNINNWDFGYETGVGIQQGFGITKFIIELKLCKSLNDIDNSENTLKNRYFGISVGILTQVR